MRSLKEIFLELWRDYNHLAPQSSVIFNAFKDLDILAHDHIAFRTLRAPGYQIDEFMKVFTDLGYQTKLEYHFKEKKLFARHFEHPSGNYPKIFTSELLLKEFSLSFQEIWSKILVQAQVQRKDFPLCRPWDTPLFDWYEKLLKESEYGAWLYAFGFRANHFTLLVNTLTGFKDLEEVNSYLLGLPVTPKIQLNTSGGVIKGGPSEYLAQSSTLAPKMSWEFQDGLYLIPTCYYEFAQRFSLPSGDLYSGFVATSADKIFESTNTRES